MIDPTPQPPTGEMPEPEDLLNAILYRDADEARTILSQAPHLAHALDRDGQPVIVVARYRYELEILDALLDAAGELSMLEAVVAGDEARVREIASSDPAALRTYSVDGFTPLHLAAYFSQLAVTSALLDLGADPAAWTDGEEALQALHLAALRPQNAEVVAVLSAAGAPIDEAQDGGLTPLHRAALAGDAGNVAVLLEAGARPDLHDDYGRTPAEAAFGQEHDDLAAVLRAAEATFAAASEAVE